MFLKSYKLRMLPSNNHKAHRHRESHCTVNGKGPNIFCSKICAMV